MNKQQEQFANARAATCLLLDGLDTDCEIAGIQGVLDAVAFFVGRASPGTPGDLELRKAFKRHLGERIANYQKAAQ
jgi:hypothetical protein